MQLRNKQDFWSGIMFVVLGIGFALGATSYSMGTAARMGPGYFPFWLGVIMALLGAYVTFSAFKSNAEKTEVGKFDWPIILIIILSVAGTGVVFNYLGVYVSIFLLVFVSSFASHVFNWKVSLITAICLVLFVWAAFVKGLGLIFPQWPVFLAG